VLPPSRHTSHVVSVLLCMEEDGARRGGEKESTWRKCEGAFLNNLRVGNTYKLLI
jgi:hypothetical protein